MDKIKILYIAGERLFGNSYRKLLSVIRNLDSNKYEFSIVCPENLLFLECLKPFNIPMYVIELPGRVSTKYTKLLNSLQSGEKFNIVHSFDYVSGIYSRELKKYNSEIKCIHSPEPLIYLEKEGLFSRQVKKSTEQYLSQFSDMMIFENDFDKKLALNNKYVSQNKAVVISNSVNLSRFANLKKKNALLKELGFNKNDFIIGNVSNFDASNNQQIIVRSAYYLLKKYPQMKFLFIGDGKKLHSMMEYAKEAKLDSAMVFIFEKQNLQDYYSIMDIFVLADLWGGSSTILLEAMASRLPVICSVTSSYIPIIRDENISLTFDPNDTEGLFEAIEQLHTNKQLREMVAQNAMIEATQYDEAEIFPKIGEVYREVLST
ncbi:MAG TPA: glycosyltransferase [Ignavibacteria bacterium]